MCKTTKKYTLWCILQMYRNLSVYDNKCDIECKTVCKPSSVLDYHLSRHNVAVMLKRFYDKQATYSRFLLHRVGFTWLPASPQGR